MDDNVQRNGKNVVIDICDDSSNDDGNDEKRLDELTVETVEAYTWVLERFLDSMDHKKPVSVMTDGDKAMRRAIKTVLPDVNHHLCKWHLKKNAVSNVHVPGFLADFEKCMSMSTEEEFEVAWKNLLDDYSLHQNKWAVDVYKKKTLWAEAYLRGIFFAGAKSTQRVEGMNAYMNRFLKLRLKLFEFVQAFDMALAKLRHNEAKVQVESVNSTPVLSTCMKRIEKHAADTYTRGIFNKFLKEIKKEQSLFKVDKIELEDFRVYYLSRYQQSDATWSVNYQPNDGGGQKRRNPSPYMVAHQCQNGSRKRQGLGHCQAHVSKCVIMLRT